MEDSLKSQDGFLSNEYALIDHDETCSQDTAVEPFNSPNTVLSDHEDSERNVLLTTNSDLLADSNKLDNSDYIQPTELHSDNQNLDCYNIQGIDTKLTLGNEFFYGFNEIENSALEESNSLDDLPEIFQSGNPFFIDDAIEHDSNLSKTMEITVLEDDKVYKEPDEMNCDVFKPEKYDTPQSKSKESSSFNTPQRTISSFQLPEWQNQDFSELWGFMGADEGPNDIRNVSTSNNLKDQSFILDLLPVNETELEVLEHQDLPSIIEITDDYKKLEPIDFHLNLVTSTSIDGLSKIATEWEELQKENSNINDCSKEIIHSLPVNNELGIEWKKCEYIQPIPVIIEQKIITNPKSLFTIGPSMNAGPTNDEVDHRNTKLSIFDQKTQVISSKIDDLPNAEYVLKSKIETKNLVVDTGKFEKREEPKFVQLPKKEISNVNDTSSVRSKKVTFGVF